VHRVLLRGLRGYDREFARLAPLVEASGLVAASSGVFDAHALLGNGARSPAWPVLAPHVSAFAGLAHIVRTQLRVLELNAAGLRAGVDAEYLHDSRIALRRLRTLLGQLEGVLDAEQQAHLVAELRWLAGCTGAARDLDILLFAMRLSEPELRADLAPVLSILEQVRERAQHELVAALDSPRSAECLRSLRAAFWAGNEQGRNGPRAGSPFARVLAKRLRRRLRQVLTRAERVGGASPAAELYGLRIACKKLRYLLECCRGLAPKPVLVPCFAPLKGLQEILGQVQDAEVEVGLVHELAMGPAAGAGARVHLALGRFLERSVQRGCSARDRYPELASALLAPPVRAQLEVLVEALEARAPSQR
jgi:CHAD domain-containing protein